jgi:hypothetical protein
MASIVFALEKLAMFAIVLAVTATFFWANWRMVRRVRAAGSILAAAHGPEAPIMFGAILIGILALAALRVFA